MSALMELLVLMAWIVGIVLAKGFWSTLFAVMLPPWALYLVAERIVIAAGWLA